MSKPKNIQLPYDVFIALLDVLEYVDMSNYTDDFRMQFEGILEILRDKKNKLELRDRYSDIIHANDEIVRDLARIEYLRDKARL